MVRLTVTISENQKEWLDAHPSVNPSGVLQEALNERMQQMDGYITMEQFELEKEGLYKKILKVLNKNENKAMSMKSLVKQLDMPGTLASELKVRGTINLFGFRKIEVVIIKREEFFRLKKNIRG